jgi:hypothetical protein
MEEEAVPARRQKKTKKNIKHKSNMMSNTDPPKNRE